MLGVIGFLSRATGLGSVAITLILLASSAAAVTGTYVLWKRSVIHQRDLYWQARMVAEKDRVEKIISTEGMASAKRVTELSDNIAALQKRINDDEEVILTDPNATADGLGLDGVRRLDSIH